MYGPRSFQAEPVSALTNEFTTALSLSRVSSHHSSFSQRPAPGSRAERLPSSLLEVVVTTQRTSPQRVRASQSNARKDFPPYHHSSPRRRSRPTLCPRKA